MKGHVFDPVTGQHTWYYGGRTVASTQGTLFNFLPSAADYINTISVVFPDFTKDYHYHHWWISDWDSGANAYGLDEGANSSITVVPQEWSATTNLVAAPAGANIFASMVRINRTGNPSTWGGGTIDVLPKTNQWIPFFGSVEVEAEVGMARVFSLYISGGYLVLHRQQSISVAPGGYGAYGDAAPGVISNSAGGSHTWGTTKGIPVYARDSKNIAPYTDAGDLPPPPTPSSCAYGGANAASVTDITDYQSTYNIEIVGKFGRRS